MTRSAPVVRILRMPELAPHVSVGELGKLLPEEVLEPLEEQYLSKQQVDPPEPLASPVCRVTTLVFSPQDELASFIHRILEEAKEKWSKGEEPAREDGCFTGTVAYDIIQVRRRMHLGRLGGASSPRERLISALPLHQCIHGMVTTTQQVVGDRAKAQSITAKVKDSMSR